MSSLSSPVNAELLLLAQSVDLKLIIIGVDIIDRATSLLIIGGIITVLYSIRAEQNFKEEVSSFCKFAFFL